MTTLSFPFLRAMEKPKRSINRMETPAPLAQLPENLSADVCSYEQCLLCVVKRTLRDDGPATGKGQRRP